MDKKRVFIAVPATAEFQRLAMKYSLDHAQIPIRWLAGKNLHITLVPPWETDPDQLAQTTAVLADLPARKPFELHIDTIEFGPDPNAPRLLWAKGQAPNQLLQLKGDIEQAIDYHPDRTFTLHITLARFNPNAFDPNWAEMLTESVHWNMLVDHFAIMETKKSNGIMNYPIVREFKF